MRNGVKKDGFGAPFGHSDFPGYPEFDWTKLDEDWETSPFNVFTGGMKLHFKTIFDIINDLNSAIDKCDKDKFIALMHQGQDYYSHFSKGYDEVLHTVANLIGSSPDNDTHAWIKAKLFTDKMLKIYKAKCSNCQFK